MVLQINLQYDLVGSPWLATIWATVFPGGSREWPNNSCQLQPDRTRSAGEDVV